MGNGKAITWVDIGMLIGTVSMAVILYFSLLTQQNSLQVQEQTLNFTKKQVQSIVVPVIGYACPDYLTTESFQEKKFNPQINSYDFTNYVNPSSVSFSLVNLGVTPTNVAVFIETDNVDAKPEFNFSAVNSTTKIYQIIFRENEQITYSLTVQPKTVVDTAPTTISFKIFYTYLDIGDQTVQKPLLDCEYLRNESIEQDKNTKFYMLKKN